MFPVFFFFFFESHFLCQVQVGGGEILRGVPGGQNPEWRMASLPGWMRFTYPIEQKQICLFSCCLQVAGDLGRMSWDLSDGVFGYQEGYWT